MRALGKDRRWQSTNPPIIGIIGGWHNSRPSVQQDASCIVLRPRSDLTGPQARLAFARPKSRSPHALEYAARHATAAGTVRIRRVRAIRVRQRMNNDGGAVRIEDAQVPWRYRDTAGHMRHRP